MGEFIAIRIQDRDDVPIHSAQHFVTSGGPRNKSKTTFGIIIAGKTTLGYLDLCGARSMLTSLPINSSAVPTVTHSLKMVASFWNAIIKMFFYFCLLD
jgi:hypothetical protein